MRSKGYIAGAVFTAMVAVIAFIFGLVIASNINIFSRKNVEETFALENNPHTLPGSAYTQKSPFTSIAKQILPAVVNISAERIIRVKSPFFDFPFQEFFGQVPKEFERKAKSLGSGVIFSEQGYILTNNHVVQGADKIIVTLSDNTTYKSDEVKIIGTDSKTDVAVLKIATKEHLKFAKLGDSDKLEIGDWAIAFGSPFGFSQTMTVGVISAKGRTNVLLSHGPTYQDFIQTDAAINSGNSGGPLVSIDGEVIGINSAIASPSGGNVGIGFAVPANLAKSIANQLINKGRITRGWIGVSIQELTPEIAKGLNLKNAKGVIITKVLSNSPAAKSGLMDGDIIIKFDGETVTDLGKFRFKVAESKPRSRIKTEIIRDGKEKTFSITIAEMPSDEQIVKSEEQEQKGWLGLTVSNVGSDEEESGVKVVKVGENSPAAEAGIENEDIIKRIGNIYIRNLSDYKKATKIYEKSPHITFQIKKQNGYIIFLAIEQ